MKRVLILWGGWEGHAPDRVAERLGRVLEERGYETTVTSYFGILMSEDISGYDVIVPIWSCGIKGDIYLDCLLDFVKGGGGLSTFHGGINWFEQEKYYEMIGGFYVYDTESEDYPVKIVDPQHFITKSQQDFVTHSEKYFLQTDPTNKVLAVGRFQCTDMPIAWTRRYGQGRVFYTALAHSMEALFKEESLTMLLNGIDWCAGREE